MMFLYEGAFSYYIYYIPKFNHKEVLIISTSKKILVKATLDL